MLHVIYQLNPVDGSDDRHNEAENAHRSRCLEATEPLETMDDEIVRFHSLLEDVEDTSGTDRGWQA
jgi:hypothetical protein